MDKGIIIYIFLSLYFTFIHISHESTFMPRTFFSPFWLCALRTNHFTLTRAWNQFLPAYHRAFKIILQSHSLKVLLKKKRPKDCFWNDHRVSDLQLSISHCSLHLSQEEKEMTPMTSLLCSDLISMDLAISSFRRFWSFILRTHNRKGSDTWGTYVFLRHRKLFHLGKDCVKSLRLVSFI